MPTVRGQADVRRFIAKVPDRVANTVLRGAARAAAMVVAEEARSRSASAIVARAIQVKTRVEEGRVVGKVIVKGRGAYLAPWLEYGTAPHFISVDDSQRGGLSIRRVNKKVREGSLVINGKFVGDTVHHPGARPHPFLRPALDVKEGEAVEAAQSFINARVTKSGIASVAGRGDDA